LFLTCTDCCVEADGKAVANGLHTLLRQWPVIATVVLSNFAATIMDALCRILQRSQVDLTAYAHINACIATVSQLKQETAKEKVLRERLISQLQQGGHEVTKNTAAEIAKWEQKVRKCWMQALADNLRARFPLANLIEALSKMFDVEQYRPFARPPKDSESKGAPLSLPKTFGDEWIAAVVKHLDSAKEVVAQLQRQELEAEEAGGEEDGKGEGDAVEGAEAVFEAAAAAADAADSEADEDVEVGESPDEAGEEGGARAEGIFSPATSISCLSPLVC
jgi:hypothetical protein